MFPDLYSTKTQDVREREGSFMEHVIRLPLDDPPIETIDKLNSLLGLDDPGFSGKSIMEQSANAGEVGKTCVYHWSFAANSLWSGEAGLQGWS